MTAVIGESGYADLPLLLRDRLPEESGLPSFFNPGIFLMAKLSPLLRGTLLVSRLLSQIHWDKKRGFGPMLAGRLPP